MDQDQYPDWRAHQLCKYCSGGDGDTEENNTMLLCDCCVAVGAHLKCLQTHTGKVIEPAALSNPSFEWFCGEECEHVNSRLVSWTGVRRPLGTSGLCTAELARFSKAYRNSQITVGTAEGLFKRTFGPARYSDGSDLVELVCRGINHSIENEPAEEQPPDCSNFCILALRKGGTLVSAAAVRVHGAIMAEVPYLATREGYRREGHCKKLMTALEALLQDVGVKWIVLPAAHATVPIWIKHLGFEEATSEASEQLESRIIMPDETKILLRRVSSDPVDLNDSKTAQLGQSASRSTTKRVRFAAPITLKEDSDFDSDMDTDGTPSKGMREYGTKSRHRISSNKSDDEYDVRKDMEEEENDDEDENIGEDKKGVGIMPDKKACTNSLPDGNNAAIQSSQSVHGQSTATPSLQTPSSDDTKSCYNCGTTDTARWSRHKDAGNKWECSACKRYRSTHKGDLRPPKVYANKVNKTQLKDKTNEHSMDIRIHNAGPSPLPPTATPAQVLPRRRAAQNLPTARRSTNQIRQAVKDIKILSMGLERLAANQETLANVGLGTSYLYRHISSDVCLEGCAQSVVGLALKMTGAGIPVTRHLENANKLEEARHATQITKEKSMEDISRALVARQCQDHHPHNKVDAGPPYAADSQVVADAVQNVQEEANAIRKAAESEIEKLRAELHALKSSLENASLPHAAAPSSRKKIEHGAPSSMPRCDISSSKSILQRGKSPESPKAEDAPGLFSLFQGLETAKSSGSIIKDNDIATEPVNGTAAGGPIGDTLAMVCADSFQSISALLVSRGSQAHGTVDQGH